FAHVSSATNVFQLGHFISDQCIPVSPCLISDECIPVSPCFNSDQCIPVSPCFISDQCIPVSPCFISDQCILQTPGGKSNLSGTVMGLTSGPHGLSIYEFGDYSTVAIRVMQWMGI
ncbi:hypothetical protein PoB_006309300, partial [Plakobranchus ocellatus]